MKKGLYWILVVLFYCISGETVYGTIKKGKKDKYEYKHYKLSNGATVVLMRRDDLKECAAVVNVDVGYSCDPDDAQGLAHLLEHMLFTGSLKYPVEDLFSSYVGKMGGYYNAITGISRTTYYFSVSVEAFERSLGMFCEFFKEPLMREESLFREVKIVDIEHKGDVCNIDWKVYRLKGILNKEGSRFRKFGTGNLKTLGCSGIYERIWELWKREYSGEKFRIVIAGPESFEKLSEYGGYFDGLPVREKQEKKDVDELFGYFHYDVRYTGKLVKMKPIVSLGMKGEGDVFLIVISIPSLLREYKKKTIEYIMFVIRSKKEGGFIDVMKRNGYASDVVVGYEDRGVNGEVSVSLSLLPKGVERICLIRRFLKEYFSVMVENVGSDVYSVLRVQGENLIEALEGGYVLEQALRIAQCVPVIPICDVLVYEAMYSEYDSEEIKKIIRIMMLSEKWISIWINGDEVEYDFFEEFYEVDYKIDEYSSDSSDLREFESVKVGIRWPFVSILFCEIPYEKVDGQGLSGVNEVIGKMVRLSNVKEDLYSELKENAWRYMNENVYEGKEIVGGVEMDVIGIEEVSEGLFSCGLRNEYGELRYVVKKEFEIREIVVCISIETGWNSEDIDRYVRCVGYFLEFYERFMSKYEYEIMVLGVKILVFGGGKKLEVRMCGAAVGVYAVGELFFREYVCGLSKCDEEFVSKARSRIVLKYLQRMVVGDFLGKLKDEMIIRVSGYGYRSGELLESARRIVDGDGLDKICSGYIRMLVIGGGISEAIEFYGRVRGMFSNEEKFRKGGIYGIDGCVRGVVGEICSEIYFCGFDKSCSMVAVCYDFGEVGDYKASGFVRLMCILLGEKFYSELRVQEGYGYVVYMGRDYVCDMNLIWYVVSGEREVEEMCSRILKFVSKSYKIIEEMTSEEFDECVGRISDQGELLSESVSGYGKRIFGEWECVGFDLKRECLILRAMRKISRGEMIEYLKEGRKRVVGYLWRGE